MKLDVVFQDIGTAAEDLYLETPGGNLLQMLLCAPARGKRRRAFQIDAEFDDRHDVEQTRQIRIRQTYRLAICGRKNKRADAVPRLHDMRRL